MTRFLRIKTLLIGASRLWASGLLALAVGSSSAQASTLLVTSPADSGPGSLRAVIIAAQSGDQIVFDQSLTGQTIALTSGQLAIDKSLDIEGPGADELAVSGNHSSRVFSISGAVTVTIAGLTITDGRVVGADGGGILNVGSTLTLAHDVLSHNQALGAPGVPVSIPIPFSIETPACMLFPRRVIGPTFEDIWFIMWCGKWQCSIQSPGLLATNSKSRACATPTSTVLPGYHASFGLLPPSVPVM